MEGYTPEHPVWSIFLYQIKLTLCFIIIFSSHAWCTLVENQTWVIPEEVTKIIFAQLNPIERNTMRLVSKHFKSVVDEMRKDTEEGGDDFVDVLPLVMRIPNQCTSADCIFGQDRENDTANKPSSDYVKHPKSVLNINGYVFISHRLNTLSIYEEGGTFLGQRHFKGWHIHRLHYDPDIGPYLLISRSEKIKKQVNRPAVGGKIKKRANRPAAEREIAVYDLRGWLSP